DVIVTFIGLFGYRAALWASVFAFIGALLGGAMMYFFGVYEEEWVTGLVLGVPAISAEVVGRVRLSIADEGLLALILGPRKGIPYKIYAIYAADAGIGFGAFLLASVPSRFVRFFATGMLAAFLSQTVFPRLGRGVKVTA